MSSWREGAAYSPPCARCGKVWLATASCPAGLHQQPALPSYQTRRSAGPHLKLELSSTMLEVGPMPMAPPVDACAGAGTRDAEGSDARGITAVCMRYATRRSYLLSLMRRAASGEEPSRAGRPTLCSTTPPRHLAVVRGVCRPAASHAVCRCTMHHTCKGAGAPHRFVVAPQTCCERMANKPSWARPSPGFGRRRWLRR